MARTRSVLIDNTLGRIFRNISSVGDATAANLIAGSKIESLAITAKTTRTAAKVANNIGTGSGIFFIGGSLVNLISITAFAAPAGQPIIVRVKMGFDYASATTIGDYQLASKSADYPITLTVPPFRRIYFDILQVGSIRPGTGLSVRLSFFRG